MAWQNKYNKRTYQNVSRSDDTELQILGCALLELSVSATQVIIGTEDILNQGFDLREEIDEFDIRCQQQGARVCGAQVIL